MKKHKCEICKQEFTKQNVVHLNVVRDAISETAKKIYGPLDENGYICFDDLTKLRQLHLENLIKENKGDISSLDKMVIDSLQKHYLITQNINKKFEKKLTFGEKLADRVSGFGGSWKFISIFMSFIFLWMIYNTIVFFNKSFDPYPYILLNLILSCLAAIQAPIIMMSQNRQAQKDRMQSEDDYLTNLKAELEIRQMHAKLDQFMKNGWDRLLEIQQIQIDLAEEILKISQENSTKKKNKNS